ncbi:beta-lactamase [Methanocaldococcus villosus KIN24-T80]|uniref:Beta-lactamase n=1 Tax=Methanocaldococcus villosus KIN24-T80 TaxID=1069083 RepID=N6V093_9EURY|nr:MBL fold metallo-hydrolase [Methanocaldococcus villosus]ENN95733.1 beta-lactamase [Methanocaldococcus villosus KIN24-T80]
MEIKILVDNTAYKRFYAQHGFSVLVNNKKRVLFDAGQSEIIIKNLKLFNELENFDYFVLSHGHYDHSDGLKYLLDYVDKIIAHKDAFIDRFCDGRYIGIDKDLKDIIMKKCDLILIEEPYKIEKDIIVSGYVPREHYYELDNFECIKDGKRVKDYVNDDMFIIAKNILITGCAHSGIINVIEYGKKIMDIDGVLGGFHLINASKEYIDYVYNYLSKQDFWFMPMHCTGFNALKKLSDLKNFVYGHVGKVIK